MRPWSRLTRKASPHRHDSFSLIALSILFACILAPLPARAQIAQSVGKDVGANAEVINAADAVEKVLVTMAAKSDAVRGTSGILGALLLESDSLICDSWMIQLSLRITRMQRSIGPFRDVTQDEKELLDALKALRGAVEEACRKGTTRRTASVVAGAGVTETLPEPESDPRAECWAECGHHYYVYARNKTWAKPERASAQQSRTDARIVEGNLEVNLKERQQITRELRQINARMDKVGRTPWDNLTRAEKDQVPKDGLRRDTLTRERKTLREESREMNRELKELTKKGERAERQAKRYEARSQAALKAYEECMKKCMAGERHTSLWENTTTRYALLGGAGLGAGLVLTAGDSEPTTPVISTGTPTTTFDVDPIDANGTWSLVSIAVSGGDRAHDCCTWFDSLRGRNIISKAGSISFTGPEPWVTVQGDFDSRTGEFSTTGSGTVADFPNIGVSFRGSITAGGRLTGTYSMGTGGGLPGGRSIEYMVEGRRQ